MWPAYALIYQDTEFFVPPNQKINRLAHVPKGLLWEQFVQVKKWDFTVPSAMLIGAVVCDTHFEQKDYLLVVCVHMIYKPLPSQNECNPPCLSHQAQIAVMSADTEELGSLYKLPTAWNTTAEAVAALFAALMQLVFCCQMPRCQLMLPHIELDPATLILSIYSLWYCQMPVSKISK